MKKKIFYLIMSFFVFDASAELSGDFEKTSGPDICSTGNLQIKTNQKLKERVVLFGSRLSWTLSLEDKGQSDESVESGCTYKMSYEKKSDSLIVNTEKSNCPAVDENGIVIETLDLKKDTLIYKYEFNSVDKKKNTYSCNYKRKK